MNNLLFYALLLALFFYCFYYLPRKKSKLSHQPSPFFNPNKQTQTDPYPTETPTEVTGPKAIECPGPEFATEDKELENALDSLIKNIQNLKKELN